MSSWRGRSRRPSLSISTSRKQDASTFPVEYAENGGALTPDVQGSLGSTFQKEDATIRKVGKYLVLDGKDTSAGPVLVRKAMHLETRKEYAVKVVPLASYRDLLAPYWAVGSHPHISEISEILLDSSNAYVVFEHHVEDLHSYVRCQRRLRESEAAELFYQMVSAVKYCHKNGVVLRDLKLRKFVFTDANRTHLFLEGLEEAHVLNDDEDDRLTDKHGCLAYVSPEILYSRGGYSGKLADVWSLGVILYTMLIGQYPFHDSDVGTLFKKIRLGTCTIPDTVSPLGKCLLRNLLRTDPLERLSVREILKHPWFRYCRSKARSGWGTRELEQAVPELRTETEPDLMSSSQADELKGWAEVE